MRHSQTAIPDEEALAAPLAGDQRRRTGAYFTPASLVQWVLGALRPWLPPSRPLAFIDPSCGAGAFLAEVDRQFPTAQLLGLELSPAAAAHCRGRVPRARVAEGDAFRGGLEPLLATVPTEAFEVWVGNPPYNGTSPLLEDPAAYARIRTLLPRSFELPKGTSLRDDYAFFLLLAAQRLERRPGILAFVTSATLLDAFLYRPVRQALLTTLQLRSVLDMAPGVFSGTRVRTCVTVWESGRPSRGSATYQQHPAIGGFEPAKLSSTTDFSPEAPEFFLRPIEPRAARLDGEWNEQGERLSALIPISFPGLKTRFDELLVDPSPDRLLARIKAFLDTPLEHLSSFAEAFDIPSRCFEKLRRLKASLEGSALEVDPQKLRPFFRYAGARHRDTIPLEARVFCYLDRRLIPRGDHRLRGAYDPHHYPFKMVFNSRELPLSAAILEQPGCVHDHRHARFAPFRVPERIRDGGLSLTRSTSEFGPLVPNLSPRGEQTAQRMGGEAPFFRALTAFINGPEVQTIWAPAYGASRELPVPLQLLSR